ncbi:hypothetical protein ANANG_G00143890 [Anguilla anguilla]|uniref:Fructose-2,6-bisphosphatase TIGAR n=1 Tax=Anguilla anguilla TaxID=7936 RepID=A0A9D3MBB7_ANGAN|nr:hypothetical protein ANANG_G00143890 [Anguilla anguilla]
MLTFGLTIVRHGETQYNKDKLLQGQGVDLPLSETGLWQAEIVGNYLSDLKFTNAFSSDLQRARQTADIILKNNLHSSGLEVIRDPLLKERSFGIAEGRPVDHLKNMASAAGQSCPSFTPPQGETPEQVKLRVEEFMRVLFLRMVADHCSPDEQREGPNCSGRPGVPQRDRRGPSPAGPTTGSWASPPTPWWSATGPTCASRCATWWRTWVAPSPLTRRRPSCSPPVPTRACADSSSPCGRPTRTPPLSPAAASSSTGRST